MADIQVVAIDDFRFEVTVSDRSTTRHMVSIQPDYAQQLTQGKRSNAELIRQSFVFLLAREPNTSILQKFDLSVIARYFPEYEQQIAAT